MEKLSSLMPCFWECEMVQLLCKIVWHLLAKLFGLTMWPSNYTLEHLSQRKDLFSCRISIQMLIAAFLHTVQNWLSLFGIHWHPLNVKNHAVGEWLKKPWCIHTMDYSAIKRDRLLSQQLELTSGSCQLQKVTYCMVPIL